MEIKNFISILLITVLICSCKEKPKQHDTQTDTSQDFYSQNNIEGEEITKEKIDTTGCFMYHPEDFPDHLKVIRKDEKAGVIDTDNHLIVPCIYASIEGMYRNYELLGVRRTEDRRCGMIDFKTGQLVIDYDYHSFDRISHTDRFIKAYTDGQKYCILDVETESVAIPPKYWTIWAHGGYFFCNEGNNRYKLIDSTNTVVSDYIYDKVYGWDDKKGSLGFIVRREGQYGVMMKKSGEFKEVVPCEYDDISELNPSAYVPVNPLLVLMKNNKYGIVSTKGEILLPCEYDKLSEGLELGMLKMSRDNKWGLVEVYKDKINEVAPCIYDNLSIEVSEDREIKAFGTITDVRTDTIDYQKIFKYDD